MALTDAQTISLYEILDVPYDASVDIVTDKYGLDALTRNAVNSEYKLQTKINARIAALTSAEEIKLAAHIAAWDALGYNVTTIDGSVGGVGGLSDDPDRERKRIRSFVQVIIPVLRYMEEISNSGNDCGYVPIIR